MNEYPLLSKLLLATKFIENSFTFYLSNDIIINRINTITNERGKNMKSIIIDVNPCEDIMVNGLCFIKIKGKAKLKLYTIDKVGVYKRKSLI